MTNILDNTIGVLICVGCLRGIEWSLARRNRKQYISGNYYTKEKVIVQIEIMDVTKGEVKDNIQVDIDRTDDFPKKREMNEEREMEASVEMETVEEGREDSHRENNNENKDRREQNTQAIMKYQYQ